MHADMARQCACNRARVPASAGRCECTVACVLPAVPTQLYVRVQCFKVSANQSIDAVFEDTKRLLDPLVAAEARAAYEQLVNSRSRGDKETLAQYIHPDMTRVDDEHLPTTPAVVGATHLRVAARYADCRSQSAPHCAAVSHSYRRKVDLDTCAAPHKVRVPQAVPRRKHYSWACTLMFRACLRLQRRIVDSRVKLLDGKTALVVAHRITGVGGSVLPVTETVVLKYEGGRWQQVHVHESLADTALH